MKLAGIKYIDRTNYLASKITGKKALHLGCTGWPETRARLENGTHLHKLLVSRALKLYGVDLDSEGITLLKSLGIGELILGDVYKLDQLSLPEDFDVVIAGELIEHMENAGLFLQSVSAVMNPGCELIITTPNSYSIKAMLHALFGYDHQDPTHISIYSFTTLSQLLVNKGFAICEIYTAPYIQLSERSRLINFLLTPFCKLFPQFADNIVLSAKKVS